MMMEERKVEWSGGDTGGNEVMNEDKDKLEGLRERKRVIKLMIVRESYK